MMRSIGQWTHMIKSNFSQIVNKSSNHLRMSMGYLEPLVNSFHTMFTWSRDHGRLFASEQNDHKISKYLSRDWREESRRSITIYPPFPMSPYNERKYYETSKDHRNRNFPVTKRSTPLLCKMFLPSHPTPAEKLLLWRHLPTVWMRLESSCWLHKHFTELAKGA